MGKKDKDRRGRLEASRPWIGGADLRALAEDLPDALLVVDSGGVPCYANARGRALGLLPGARWTEMVAPGSREAAQAAFAAARADGQPREVDLLLLDPVGPPRPIRARLAPVTEQRRAVRWLLTFPAEAAPPDAGPDDLRARHDALLAAQSSDQTAHAATLAALRTDLLAARRDHESALADLAARHEAILAERQARHAAALAETETRHAGVLQDLATRHAANLSQVRARATAVSEALDEAGIGVFELDLGTGAFHRAGAHDRLLGLENSPPGWTLDATEAQILDSDRPAFREALGSALEAGHLDVEVRVAWPDGSLRVLRLTGRVLAAEGASPARLAGLVQDVTAAREREARLRAAEPGFRDRLDALPAIVWQAQPDGWVDHWSATWSELTGQRPGAGEGQGWTACIHPDDRPALRERWRAAFQAGDPLEAEVSLHLRDGRWRWAAIRGRPVRDAQGRILRWMGTVTDLDDLVRANRELSELRRALAEAEARADDLARARVDAAASHEALTRRVRELGTEVAATAQALSSAFGILARRSAEPALAEVARHGGQAAERALALARELRAAVSPGGRDPDPAGDAPPEAPLPLADAAGPQDAGPPPPAPPAGARTSAQPPLVLIPRPEVPAGTSAPVARSAPVLLLVPAMAAPPEEPEVVLDRLAGRLRSAELRACLEAWRAARRAPAPPWPGSWPGADAPTIMSVAPHGSLSTLDEGSAPDSPLARVLARGPAISTWRACVHDGMPLLDFAEAGLGPRRRERLERLALPWSTDGARVDRITVHYAAEARSADRFA